jgi:Protein of unknown function (DUF3775)
MSRTTKLGLSDLNVVQEVIRLDDALIVAEQRSNTDEYSPEAWSPEACSPERTALFEYLSGLSDVRMAELHALYWLGNRLSGSPRTYDTLYELAMNNLDHGASYLSGKPLAERLRRGLAKLGLPPDRTAPRSGQDPYPDTNLED